MGGAAVIGSEPDYGDIQGLVRFGYGRLTAASYALLRVREVAAARAWLLEAPIAAAVTVVPPPSTAMQIAFTADGLEAIGVSPAVRAAFSPEFLGGMVEPNRSRRLGDVGINAPAQWQWGDALRRPHLLVMFFAEPSQLDAWVHATTGATWHEAFEVLQWMGTADLDGVEPFGFADGISQPAIDWSQQRNLKHAGLDYTNVSALGEFVLGYRNEYGKYTDRPIVDPDDRSAGLPDAEDAPGKKDVGRNGTYLVMRQLRQDVRSFWQFVWNQAGGEAVGAERLAAAFVGRTRAGDPLVPVQITRIPGIGSDPEQVRQNQFTFDRDPDGIACPIGAHVRRANPRNADYPGRPTGVERILAAVGFGDNAFRDDLMSSVRFHRILRRGREYGPGLSPADARTPAPPDDPERGLHFICVNANISRQFEFLQNAWMMSSKFSGLAGETDPLLGNREATPGCPVTSAFTMPQDGRPPARVSNLPQFVTVRGGAYFFLPGLRAVRYFAAAQE